MAVRTPRLLLLVLLAITLATLAPCAVLAQDRPADGTYENFSSLLMRPVGPLDSTPTLLPRWVEVRTEGDVTTVTFLPDARVVWRITWGASGPAEKLTFVDGELFTRSVYERDPDGHLVRKIVSGPGAGSGVTYAYTTDERGRIETRTAVLPPTPSAASAGLSGETEVVSVTWGADRTTVRTTRDGTLLREDTLDPEGRRLSITVHARDGSREASVRFRRARDGTLRSITRRMPGRGATPADATHPDAAIEEGDVFLVLSAPMERHEALLFLGAPITSTDAGTGVARAIDDDWASGCWLNVPSGARFDPSGLAVQTSTACICGFCVDATLEVSATSAVLATDLHWTRGPWVRLDGALDVTVEHALVTPSGPVRAGALVAGDVVLGADGEPRVLVSVEHLHDAPGLRLGRNLRTESGTFAAGGFLLASEEPRACSPER